MRTKLSFGFLGLLVAFLLIVGTTAQAIPHTHVNPITPGGPCAQTILTDYVSLASAGCQIGDKIFSDFSYTTSKFHALPVQAAGITVTPVDNPLDAQIDFNAFWAAGPGAFTDGVLRFRVTVLPQGNPITQLELLQGGSFAVGTGLASIAETACVGGLLPGCSGGTLQTLGTYYAGSLLGGGSQLFDSVSFNPVMSVDVLKDIGVTGGPLGLAFLSHVEQHFIETPGGGGGGEVPEPGTWVLMLSGIVGLALYGRKRFSTAS